jgi:hypothetical protein
MTPHRPLAFLAAGIIFIFLTSGAKTAQQTISLEYKPNAKVKASPHTVPPLRIFFGDFKDERPDPRQVGENLEDKAKRVVIATDDPKAPGRLIESVLTNEFRKKGFRLVDQAGQAEKIVGGSLLKFWTVETSRYNTETQIKLEIRDSSGQVSFSRLVTGTGKNFGRSLSETNYNESFSDSLVMIVEMLFLDQEFIRALGEKPAPTRPIAPAPPAAKEPPGAAAKAPLKSPEPAVERPPLPVKAESRPQTAKAAEPERPAAPDPAKIQKPLPVPAEPAPPKTTAVKTAPPEPERPTAQFIEHRVIPGETMATIAKWYAGDTTLWPAIAQHNLGLNPFKLKAGEVVRVPFSLATVHLEQPEYSTAAVPGSRPLKKGPKGPPPAPPASTPPIPASPAPAIPVFGPK